MTVIKTKLKLSTAYHPETNGQIKRVNQTLKAYLRHYINNKQDNWISLLPLAQFTYNNQFSVTTDMMLFFTNFGRHLNLFMNPKDELNIEKVIVIVEDMKKLHAVTTEAIERQNATT